MRSLSGWLCGAGSLKRVSFSLILASSLAVVVLAVFSAGKPPAAEARSYSPYSDPGKTALAYVLSDRGYVEEFQRDFGLGDGRMDLVLAAVERENEALAREYAESERLVEANEGASNERVAQKIVASDYGEKTRAAIARTKSEVEGLLPRGRRQEIKGWVDERWRLEGAEVGARSGEATVRASASGLTCRIWATYYKGYTQYEVALPHQALKFRGGYRVRITAPGGTRVLAPVREVGPWNTRDDYWHTGRYRDLFADLPRCVPEAQAAYFHNYRRGTDQFGRQVLNPAGLDMTLVVASQLGIRERIQREGRLVVTVFYPWA